MNNNHAIIMNAAGPVFTADDFISKTPEQLGIIVNRINRISQTAVIERVVGTIAIAKLDEMGMNYEQFDAHVENICGATINELYGEPAR